MKSHKQLTELYNPEIFIEYITKLLKMLVACPLVIYS